MLFNSLPFAVFIVLFFVLYWLVFKGKSAWQNATLLVGSYVFYSWWDWRFLPMLIGSSVFNYLVGIAIQKADSERKKNLFLWAGVMQALGSLFVFKYYNFFVVSLVDALHLLGVNASIHTLKIILPLGISFYTFRTLSYLIDIYKEKYEPTTNPVIFFSYVAFFPSLLSGPIDRANFFIPQLEKERDFSPAFFTDGMRQILWGLFKKVVVADNLAIITLQIFDHYESVSGSTLLIGAFLYTLQLYADFSGYSDMAIGVAKLLGLRGTQNFNYPFFSQNIAEYWRRWHISLTSWLTEYVFTPLSIAFRDYGSYGLFLAILLNFVLVGLWHGANWTFVVFGIINGCLYIPLIMAGTMNKKKPVAKGKLLPSLTEFRNLAVTFTIVMFTDVLFRSDSFLQAAHYISHIFSPSLFSTPHLQVNNTALFALMFVPVLFGTEWVQREEEHGLKLEKVKSRWLRWIVYYALIFSIIMFGAFSNAAFIYFQF